MNNTMQYATRDRETGTIIDLFATEQDALDAIDTYEADDRKEGIYTADFYEVADINN